MAEFKVAKEVRYLKEAYSTTLKFVAQLKVDKKNPLFSHAKLVLDDKNFLKTMVKDIKAKQIPAEKAVKDIAGQFSESYAKQNADLMSEGTSFAADALVKEIKARKKEDIASNEEQIEVGTYLSNAIKPIDAETELVVNTNKVFLEKEPKVSEQVKIYKKILQENPNKEVSFILLNIDAINQPKWLDDITKEYGRNSLLIKGIRLGYIDQPVITHQIQAIIKASQYSENTVTIVLPMISANEEFMILQNVVKTLYEKEKGPKGLVETSVLLETPSIVMEPDLVLQNTNKVFLDLDSLVQYTLGIEKDNRLFPHLNQPLNSAVLRQVRYLIGQAKRLNNKVWIQGRNVNEPEVLCALVGIGSKHLIVSRYCVEQTQELIKKLDVYATYELMANCVENPIADDTQEAIEHYLENIE